jgi:hypothetical protein
MNVSTKDAVNGTTNADILNEDGGLVLPEGVHLTQALVNALLNQNINEVDVTFGENHEASQPIEETKSKAVESTYDKHFKEHVDHLFIRHRGPFMKEFQQCLLQTEK